MPLDPKLEPALIADPVIEIQSVLTKTLGYTVDEKLMPAEGTHPYAQSAIATIRDALETLKQLQGVSEKARYVLFTGSGQVDSPGFPDPNQAAIEAINLSVSTGVSHYVQDLISGNVLIKVPDGGF